MRTSYVVRKKIDKWGKGHGVDTASHVHQAHGCHSALFEVLSRYHVDAEENAAGSNSMHDTNQGVNKGNALCEIAQTDGDACGERARQQNRSTRAATAQHARHGT